MNKSILKEISIQVKAFFDEKKAIFRAFIAMAKEWYIKWRKAKRERKEVKKKIERLKGKKKEYAKMKYKQAKKGAKR